MHRIVASHRWEKECVGKRAKPFGIIFRIDMKGCRMSRFPKDFYNAICRTENKDGKGKVYHRYQYEINDRIQGILLEKGIGVTCRI